jgi:hypothetical protein
MLKFAEDVFGLPRLSAADTRANSPASDAFDFTQKPRPFSSFATPSTHRYFLDEPEDHRLPDAE